MPNPGAILVLASLASCALACEQHVVIGNAAGSAQPDAGADASRADAEAGNGVVLWSTDHETGDFADWEAEGGGSYTTGAPAEVVEDGARSARYGAAFTIDTSDGNAQTVRAYRRTVAEPAYYSVWFKLAEDHTPAVWWSFSIFRGQADPNDTGTGVNLWDINLIRTEAGPLALSFYDHLTDSVIPAAPRAVPVGQWVHLEAFFRYAPPADTELVYWLDGESVLELSGLGESPVTDLFWAIGNGSDALDPPVSTIYFDDAAIATDRLGPGF